MNKRAHSNLRRSIILTLSFGISVVAGGVERKRAELEVDKSEVKSELASQKKQQAEAPKLTRSAVFVIEVERQIIDAVRKTVPVLRKQAAKMPKKSLGRLNLLERVINLNFELAVFLRNEEERGYDKRYQEWDLNGRKGREPTLNTTQSKAQWKIVINDSREIMAEFPKGRNADRIVFYQAMALQQLGQEKDAARIFSELIQKFPNSPIASDAYAQLGDYFFDRNDFGNASNNYKKVTKFTQSKRYLWSIFKLAWCSFNSGRFKEALEYWQNVVAVANGRKDVEGAIQLKDQALRDMVYSFAELQMVEPAISYYRKNGGGEYIGPLLTMLSQTFAANGQFGAAIKTLKRFQQIEPYHLEAPGTQKEIISLYYALNQMPAVWKELENFGELYGPKSQWAQKNAGKNQKVVQETQVLIRDQMLTYSKLTHKEAIKDGGRSLHEQAQIGYLLFLKLYPGAKEEAEIKYNLADIEYFLKDYRKAGAYYLDIVRDGPQKAVIYSAKKSENIHKQSALYMIDAYAKDFEPEFKAMKKQETDFKKKPSKLSVRAANYINACATFAKFYPKEEKVIKTCDLDVTKVFFHSNNLEKSKQYLRTIAIKYPDSKEGPDSARQLIRLHAGDDQKVVALADELLKIPQYQKGELGKELRDLRTNIEIGSIEKINEPLKKAREYEDKAKKYPNNKDVDKLWYNAAINYAKGGDVSGALNAYLVVVKKFPKNEKAKDSLIEVAGIYERRLEFKTAVQYYQLLVKNYAKDQKEIAGGMAKACELSLALSPAGAEDECIAFARKFRDGGKIVIERMIAAADREGRYGKMASLIRGEYFKAYRLSSNEKISALHRIYSAGKGQAGGAAEAAREIQSIFASDKGVSGEALRYAAEIQFKSVDGEHAKFARLDLVGGTVDRLAQSIDRKAAALVQLKNTYERVFQTKDPYWGVAAIYRIAAANEQLSAQLSDPPEIQGAKKEEVVAQLAPKAADLKKEALNWYKIAEKTVLDFRVFNEWTPMVFNGMQRIQGINLSFEEHYEDPDYVGAPVSSSIASKLR
jgi:TolA-binding protein